MSWGLFRRKSVSVDELEDSIVRVAIDRKMICWLTVNDTPNAVVLVNGEAYNDLVRRSL